MGITHRRAVLILYGVSFVLTVAAISVSLGRSWQVGVAILVASAALVGLTRFVGYFEYLLLMRRQRARLRSSETEALRRLIPEVPALFAAARSEDEVLAVLSAMGPRAELAAIELTESGVKKPTNRWEWKGAVTDASELVSARYPLGDDRSARADLRFRWRSANGDVSPQMEVLLQVLVDVAFGALVRVTSPLVAPLPVASSATTPTERASQPAPVDG
jgi:UDP-GlcNAc:undecaprenyl-phosphate GlcNAc-1-phosphate transferase